MVAPPFENPMLSINEYFGDDKPGTFECMSQIVIPFFAEIQDSKKLGISENFAIFYDQSFPENQEFRIFHGILDRDEEKNRHFLGNFREFPLIFSKWVLEIILKLHLTLQYVLRMNLDYQKYCLGHPFFRRGIERTMIFSKIQNFSNNSV